MSTLFVSSPGAAPSTTEPVSWISRNAAVASVDTNGLIHTLTPGEAIIVGTTKSHSLSDSAVVVVYGASAPVVSISGDSTPMLSNWTRQLTAQVNWAPGVRIKGTTDVVWSSETPDIATVTASGLVQASSTGTAIIDATSKFMPNAMARMRLPVVPPPTPLTFTALTSGGEHSCAVTASMKWYCWGVNLQNELGDGTSANSPLPRPITILLAPPATVVAGDAHTCGLDTAGIAYCWGDNTYGELGGGLPVAGNITFAKLSAGTLYTCGIAVDTSVYCWGRNDSGQLGVVNGDGTTTNRSTPTLVPGIAAMAIASGTDHTCSLTPAGKAYCWGSDLSGQLGDGAVNGWTPAMGGSPRPRAVTSDSTFTTLAAGASHTCGLTPSGAVFCWGGTLYGALPVPIAGAPPFVALTAGANNVCALTADGTAYCWGKNDFGQLGDGTTVSRVAAAPVAGGLKFIALAAGYSHVCGVAASGQAYCWGSNGAGALGIGDSTTFLSKVPVPVLGPLP